MSSSLVGRKIGQYEVKGLVGRGGMATVYLGYQPTIDRRVAIKVLPPHPGMEKEFIDRFQLEARTVAKLQHPHILQLFDYGTQDDILYYVTPFIEGGSLEQLMTDGPMDPVLIERILREVAGALDYAHRQDVIHRDIKPGNILIDAENHALLADFGIVKITSSTANLTGTAVVGTPAYMAPEQAQGISDARADIYSLGVIVFEMLTGRQPYQSENTMQLMLAHVQSRIPSILEIKSDLPQALEPVMLRVLAKDPDDRYWTASEFAEDFSRALHKGESLAAIHKVLPLTPAGTPTPVYNRSVLSEQGPPPTSPFITPPPHQQPTTVIVQQTGINNTALYIGFAMLGMLIIGGIMVIASILSNPSQGGGTGTPTASVENTPAATSIPVVLEPSFGDLSFGKTSAPGDTLSLRLSEVVPPADGKVYVAWLVNTRTNETLNIGRVGTDAAGNGAVSYADDELIRSLPSLFNALIITEEEVANQEGDAPLGETRYSGSLPPEVMDLFTEIFVTSERGFQGNGLLTSALSEARFAAQHTGLASGATNLGGMRTHGEHSVNILKGAEDDLDGNGIGQNPGTGLGLYVYIDAIDEVVEAVTHAEGATPFLQTNAENIRVCIANVRLWADQIVALETEVLASEDLEAVRTQLDEATTLAAQLTDGFDQNQNGQVEPFEGECGLQRIESFGILIASIEIHEGALE